MFTITNTVETKLTNNGSAVITKELVHLDNQLKLGLSTGLHSFATTGYVKF